MAEASGSGRLPAGLILLHTLVGHTGRVNSVCWSPDGKGMAYGCSDGTVAVWNLSVVELLGRLEGSIDAWGNALSVVWSPDGKWLAFGSNDGTVRVWDPTTGKLLNTLEGHT